MTSSVLSACLQWLLLVSPHTETLSVSAAACCPGRLRMDVLETSEPLDEELYSRQL